MKPRDAFIALAALALALTFAFEAFADRDDRTISSTSRITYFECKDVVGTFFCRVCGSAAKSDGGVGYVERECVDCNSATFSGLPSACLSTWKAANGL